MLLYQPTPVPDGRRLQEVPLAVGETAFLQWSLYLTETGALITSASVSTITLTVTNELDGSHPNSRNAQNVKNLNGGTLTDGLFTFQTAAADSALVDGTQVEEFHYAVFTLTTSAGQVLIWRVLLHLEVVAQPVGSYA